jgi:hypothetical protein
MRRFVGLGASGVLACHGPVGLRASFFDELETRGIAELSARGECNGERIEGRHDVPVRDVEAPRIGYEHHTHEALRYAAQRAAIAMAADVP